MANKMTGGITAGAVGVSTSFVLRSTLNGTEVPGKVAADLTVYYWRQGEAPTAVSLSNLATISSAWTAGGVKEADATHAAGSYRLDLPDAAVDTGADWVQIEVSCSGCFTFKERWVLETQTADLSAAIITAGGAGAAPADIAAAVLNTVMAESYAADGAQATVTQALYLIMQSIIERSVSGTAVTIKKLDGATTAAVLTTNSATNPTSVTRTT
jgi:hypothetical protein